jgi:hypothetical protein
VRRQAVALFGVIVLVVASCGSGAKRLTKVQYEAHLQADGKALTRAGDAMISGRSPLADAKHVAQTQAALRRVADDLASIRPPTNAVRDNERLVKGFRAIAAAVDPLRRQLAAGEKLDLLQALARIEEPRAAKLVQPALDDLKRKRYKLGAFGT